jgi:hypothetical protein
VSRRIANAIEYQTPIVVMWSLRPWRDTGDQSLRPYSIEIDPRNTSGSRIPIQPIWVDQQASDLREIDKQTEYLEVGAVAAFTANAFNENCSVVLFSRAFNAPSGMIRHQMFGRLM